MATQVNLFLDSLKSQHTKEAYQSHWNRYLKTKPTVSKKPQIIEDSIVAYLTQMKNEGLSYSYRNSALASIKHHYKMTERRLKLNWEYITPFLGENKPDNEIRGYTTEEIQKLLSIADVKYRAIILTLCSTGMRREALAQISKADLLYIPEHKLYKITIYKKSSHEQVCFTTPEAADAIKLHLKMSEDNHQELFYFRTPKHLTSTLRKIQIRCGVGQVGDISGKKFGQSRNSIPAVHGLKKFCITKMIKSKVNTEYRKLMTDHSIGVGQRYLDRKAEGLSDDDLLQEYLKAVDELTINDEYRLQLRLKSKEDMVIEQAAANDRMEQAMKKLLDACATIPGLDLTEVRKALLS